MSEWEQRRELRKKMQRLRNRIAMLNRRLEGMEQEHQSLVQIDEAQGKRLWRKSP